MAHDRREHASIMDVARLAGVSTATVSRALRGLPNVSDATRRRVRSAARDLDYTASPAGRGLASGRTGTVGVVVPLMTRWFFAQIVSGAESVLRAAGYDLLLYNLADAEGRSRFFQRMPLRRRVDAVLVVSLPLTGEETPLLESMRVPVVTVGDHHPQLSGVRIDDVKGAGQAVRHLLQLGHESIAMISALEDDDLGFASAPDRRDGFRRAIGRSDGHDHVVTGSCGLRGGERGMEALLSGDRLPTAVFAEYDEMAFGAMLTLRRAGLRVPQDVSVVGFDDHELAPMAELTTVAQPVREQGEVAARLLVEELQGRHAPVDIVLPTRLVVRGSTAPVRTASTGRHGRKVHG